MEAFNPAKGANQLWKESGSQLPFKDWLQREKDKGRFLPNKKLSEFNNIDGDEVTPEQLIQQKLEDKKTAQEASKKTAYGLSKAVLAVSVGLVVVGIAVNVYNKRK